MKKFFTLTMLVCLAVLSYQCGDTESNNASTTDTTSQSPSPAKPKSKVSKVVNNNGGAVVKGNIKNADNLRIFFEQHSFLDNVNDIQASGEIASGGDFELQLPKGLQTGIYRIRIGRKKIYLPFDGGETDITIKGDLTNLASNTVEVEGANNFDKNIQIWSSLEQRKINASNAEASIKSTDNPVLGLMIALSAYGSNPKYLETHEALNTKLKSSIPGSVYTKKHNSYLSQLRAAAKDPIQIGKAAPDINLEDPDGKKRSLSDLKGKVVLLDFWASWCGPCRRENPNVVNVYDKYNKKGFEVFSVSLDKPNAKTRWIGAIEKDNLKWPWHVSDLRGWSSAPAKLYKVSSIPRTFLIDKNGKIADMNVRGPALEVAVKKLLSQG